MDAVDDHDLSELFDSVDPLLWDELSGGPCSGLGEGAFVALAAGAPAEATLRCLDPSHPAGCTRCTAAPPVAHAARYELVGEPGKKNGEKKLRAQLSRTREWASSAAREAAAHALCCGDARLAAALRQRLCARLTKAHLLQLCGHWRYGSDLWRLRGNRPPRAPPAAPLAPLVPPPSLQLATPSGSLSASDVWMRVGLQLRPLSTRAAALLAGSGARARAGSDACAAALYARDVAAVGHVAIFLTATWLPQLAQLTAALRGFEAELPADALSAPAVAFAFPPCVAAVPSLLAHGKAHFAQLLSLNAARRAHADVTPAALLYLDELRGALECETQLAAHMAALVTAARLSSADVFAKAAAMLTDLLAAHALAVVGGFTQRLRWLEALPPAAAAAADDDTAVPARPLFEFVLPLPQLFEAACA